ncbi:hypothetical protein PFISCL1PPCAC_2611, partial [Pristionchus fissidentatus]
HLKQTPRLNLEFMIQITVDNEFVQHCPRIFKENHIPKSGLEIKEVHFENFDSKAAEKLAEFILSLKLRKLRISHISKFPEHIFDSVFLAKFVSASTHSNYCFQYEPRATRPPNIWTPDENFLQVMCRFKKFHYNRLNMDANLLIELCLVKIHSAFVSITEKI